jgi:hypothetical protein
LKENRQLSSNTNAEAGRTNIDVEISILSDAKQKGPHQIPTMFRFEFGIRRENVDGVNLEMATNGH